MLIKNKDILVTVILTTYKSPNYLERALKSVQAQTYKNLQILVIDGAHDLKNEKLVDYASRNDNRILYWFPKMVNKKIGMYGDVQVARNVGLALANGKYAAMLDDDDEWTPLKIALQLEFAERLGASLVSCWTRVRGSNNIDKPSLKINYKKLLRNFNMSCTSSYFINRNALRKIGGFDTTLRSMHEYDIALKLAKKGKTIIVVPVPLMVKDCLNEQKSGFYRVKIMEVLDLYRLYRKDFIPQLGYRGFAFNVVKSALLVTLFLLGFVFREKVWKIIYKLKMMYQEQF